jgi:radical SAM protein with 4Fe4S-binding SPASM domain
MSTTTNNSQDAKSHVGANEPYMQIKDEDKFIVNPFFRLRNGNGRVLIYGSEGLGFYQSHRTHGIVVALCNGDRTVADIARLTRPFVRAANDEEALNNCKAIVKAIVFHFCKTKEEQQGKTARPSDFPAASVLTSKTDYDTKFRNIKVPIVQYDAEKFLPKDASDIAGPDVQIMHESAPVSINWHLTSECSTNCKYCYLGRRNVQPLPKERTLALIEEAANIGVLSVTPNGGDILLYKHLDEVLTSLGNRKFLPVMISTKSFLSKEKAKMLAAASGFIWELQFSIDSTVPEVTEYLVGVKDYTTRIFSSIENALEAGLRVTAKAVITPYNILTIPRLYRELKQRGVLHVRLATYGRSGFHHTDDLFNHKESFDWLERQINKLRNEFPEDKIEIQNGQPNSSPQPVEARQESWGHRSSCTAGRSALMICADGKTIPCEQMPETETYFCGDVAIQSIQEVWNGERLRALTYGVPIDLFKEKPCYDCEENEVCLHTKGNCIRDLAIHYGSIYQPPSNCPKARLQFVRQF